jgi:DnaJ-class molecular chaperone
MEPLAVKCDACNGSGYINGEQCWKCDGNERIVVGAGEGKVNVSQGARIIAWVAVILLCAVGAYLIGHGGK